jgi:hypothetical protein
MMGATVGIVKCTYKSTNNMVLIKKGSRRWVTHSRFDNPERAIQEADKLNESERKNREYLQFRGWR